MASPSSSCSWPPSWPAARRAGEFPVRPAAGRRRPSASAVAASPSPTAAPAFPVTLTDDEGTAVELAAEPEKIVSLTPATTEILFALGAGDRVVATDDGSDYPDGGRRASGRRDLRQRRRREGRQRSSPTSSSPAGWASRRPTRSPTADLDVPVVVVYAPSVDGVCDDIELLGTATGTSETATDADGRRCAPTWTRSARRWRASRRSPASFYDVGYDDTTGAIFAPADDSFLAEMVTLAGGDVITTGDPNTYELPLETLIDKDPQLIVLGHEPVLLPDARAVAARRGWDAMTAVGMVTSGPSATSRSRGRVHGCRSGCARSPARSGPTSRCRLRHRRQLDWRPARSPTDSRPAASRRGSAARPLVVGIAAVVVLLVTLILGVGLGFGAHRRRPRPSA